MGGYETSFTAWCSPTTAANQLGYLVDNGYLNQPLVKTSTYSTFDNSLGHTIWLGRLSLDGPSKTSSKVTLPINTVTDLDGMGHK